MNKLFELFSKVFSPGSSYTKRISVETFVKKIILQVSADWHNRKDD